MEGATIDHVGPDGVFAHHRNVLIWSWRAAATPVTCQRMRVQLVGLARANPQGAGAITVIGTEVGIPPDEIRKLMVQARREAAKFNMCGGAIVYEGDGFRGSVVRGVVTSLMLLATDIYPQSVHGDVPSAIGWLVKKMDKVAPLPMELAAAVAQVRAHKGSVPPGR